MAKLNLQEQINATSYRQPDTYETFEDFIINPVRQSSENIATLSLKQLLEYKDEAFKSITGHPQPFRPYTAKDLSSLAKSIADYGVIDPITVRPVENNKYQILAGRNRARASALCGKTTIPAIIRTDIDDITAAMIMLDTNLEQRHNLCYSEKAFAYKMRLDLQNRQGRRSDLCEDRQKVDTLSETGKEHKDSRRTVAYLIRLTYLIPEILSLVDDKKIGFKIGVGISYLMIETQNYLYHSIISEGIKPKIAAINELRRLEESSPLRPETIQSIIKAKPKIIPDSVTISGKLLQDYSDILGGTTNIKSLFIEFLKQYRNSN